MDRHADVEAPVRRHGALAARALHPLHPHADGAAAAAAQDARGRPRLHVPARATRGSTWPAGTSYEGGKTIYVALLRPLPRPRRRRRGLGRRHICTPSPPTCTTRARSSTRRTSSWPSSASASRTRRCRRGAEWMPFNQRWALVKYIVDTFQKGVQGGQSTMKPQRAARRLRDLRRRHLRGRGQHDLAGAGKQIYASFCATCHGADGQGDGPGLKDLVSAGPAAFPADMPEAYVFWRDREGVRERIMPAFQRVQRAVVLQRDLPRRGIAVPRGGRPSQHRALSGAREVRRKMSPGLWLLVLWSVGTIVAGLVWLVWGLDSGQFDDLEETKYDDAARPRARAVARPEAAPTGRTTSSPAAREV